MIWALIAAVLAVVVGGGGAVYAAQDALPGDALYPVKEMVENAQLLVADPVEDVQLHVQFAERRLAEAQALMAQGRTDLALEAMAQAEAHWQAALELAEQVRAQRPDAWPEVAAQAERLAQQLQMLHTLKEQVRHTAQVQGQQGQGQAEAAHAQVRARLAEVEAHLAEVQAKVQAILGEHATQAHAAAQDAQEHGLKAAQDAHDTAADTAHDAHDAAEAVVEGAHDQAHQAAAEGMQRADEAMNHGQAHAQDALEQAHEAAQEGMNQAQEGMGSMGSFMPFPTGTPTPSPQEGHEGHDGHAGGHSRP